MTGLFEGFDVDKSTVIMLQPKKKFDYSTDATFEVEKHIPMEDENILRQWYDYGSSLQDNYPEYHFSTMLVLMSHIIDAEMIPSYAARGIRNNMACVILGRSGDGKSASGTLGISLLSNPVISEHVRRLPNKLTPELLIQELAEKPRAFHYSNECVGFLKHMKKDYNGGLSEDLINAYDNERISKGTMKMGVITCDSPVLGLLWNTTISSWSKNVTKEEYESGFFLRPFFIICTRFIPVKLDATQTKEQLAMKSKIENEIVELCKIIGKRKIVFDENEYITKWKYDLRVQSRTNKYSDLERSTMQRIFDLARKVAMNLTIASKEFRDYVASNPIPTGNISEHTDASIINYTIPQKYAEYACWIAENVFWKNSMKAMRLTYGEGAYKKVTDALEGGEELSRTQLSDMVGMTGDRLTEFLTELSLKSETRKVPNVKKPVTFYKLD